MNHSRASVCICTLVALLIGISSARAQVATNAAVTLERIMSDPDWIARSPERPYWSDDSKIIYYSQKRLGDERRDLIRLDVASGQSRVVLPDELPTVDVRFGSYSRDRTRKVYSRAGDLYIKELATGVVRQLTRTGEGEYSPQFLTGGHRIAFQRGNQTYVRDLASGLEYQVADIRAENKPEEKKDKGDYLREQQERLFEFVKKNKAAREASKKESKEEAQADTQRVPRPWYLGDDKEIREVSLSPTGDYLLVRVGRKSPRDGRSDTMPAYVTEDGYVSTRSVRAKVGVPQRVGDELVLLDLKGRSWKEEKPEPEATPAKGTDGAKRVNDPEKKDAGAQPAPASKESSGKDGVYRIDLSVLPEIASDPLKNVRDQAEAWKKAKEAGAKESDSPAGKAASPSPTSPEASVTATTLDPAQPRSDQAKATDAKKEEKPPDATKPRPVSINQIVWSEDGERVMVQAMSLDNKDRWIAEVVLTENGSQAQGSSKGTLRPLEHFHDDAWINGQFADLGWLPDGRTIWFLSEETGYSQVYFRDLADSSRWPLQPRSEGEAAQPFEVVSVSLNRAGDIMYFTAGLPGRPGVREGYRAMVGPAQLDARRALKERGSEVGLPVQQLTELGGQNEIVPSPDDRAAVVLHSTASRPPELVMQPITLRVASSDANAFRARVLTNTITPEFQAIDWIAPEVLPIPGRDGKVIWSRVYDVPRQESRSDAAGSKPEKRPAVLFIHGAGYLQDAHEGWSYYYHEFMFHTLLVQRGYVVLDMDYRASAGYGRDWRTAIYRTMGYPELEDLEDGVAWLVKEKNVDPARVGCYGGSYGGFLTLMAMFTKPDLFACGAALRPVTDWAHYNDGYTANILNTPGVDPEPYEKCSPIEHAAGLKGNLLICHGMVDDNVLFEDTVRLAQRLIELKKENWEVAMYPIESHAFKEASSWLDEYRRIDKLFRTHLGK